MLGMWLDYFFIGQHSFRPGVGKLLIKSHCSKKNFYASQKYVVMSFVRAWNCK